MFHSVVGVVLPGTPKAPPITERPPSSRGRAGSRSSATARLVSGPRVTSWISPGRRRASSTMTSTPWRVADGSRRRRKLRVPDPERPVGLRASSPAAGRAARPGRSRPPRRPPGKLQHGQRVRRDLAGIGVARDARHRHELGVRGRDRVQEGEAVVDPRIDIEDEGRRLGHRGDATGGPPRTTSVTSPGVRSATSTTGPPQRPMPLHARRAGGRGTLRSSRRRPDGGRRRSRTDRPGAPAPPGARRRTRPMHRSAIRQAGTSATLAAAAMTDRSGAGQGVQEVSRLAARASSRPHRGRAARGRSARSRPGCRCRNRGTPNRGGRPGRWWW